MWLNCGSAQSGFAGNRRQEFYLVIPHSNRRGTVLLDARAAHLPREQGFSFCKDSEWELQEADEGRDL